MKVKVKVGSESESEMEFEEDFEDDDFEIIEVIQKDIIQEKNEKDKVYSESLQISELNKIFINQYPFLLRNNQLIKDKVIKKVNQFINLKNNILITDDKNQFNDQNNIKPLLLNYKTGNYNNKFLIPLVLNTKKIYVDENSTIDTEDYNKTYTMLQNFYDEVNSINYLINFKNLIRIKT